MPNKSDAAAGGKAAGGGATAAAPPPGPVVKAGPDGIISQNKTIDGKHAQLDPSFKPAGAPMKPMAGMLGFGGGDKKPAAPGAPGAAPAGADPAGAAPAGAPKAGGPPGAPGAADAGKGAAGGGAIDPTVQKVVDQGKQGQQEQKKALDAQKQKFDQNVDQKKQATAEETKRLDAAAAEAKKKKEDEKAKAAAAASAPPKPGDEKDKDKKPKGPIGIKVSLDILGETHTLYVDEQTGLLMVASTPTPAETKVYEAKAAINSAPASIKTEASPSVLTASVQATTTAATAKKAFDGDETAKTEIAGKQQSLAHPFMKSSKSTGRDRHRTTPHIALNAGRTIRRWMLCGRIARAYDLQLEQRRSQGARRDVGAGAEARCACRRTASARM